MGEVKKIGILTGGGDAPGLNAVIRAAAKTAILNFNLEVIGFKDGFAGLLENRIKKLSLKEVSGILPRGGTILGTTNRDNPFHYPVVEHGQKVYKDLSDRALQNVRENNLDALIVIGGDGSLILAYKLFQKGLPVVGVPKTIDNDLSATDQTFGFDTALTTATEAIDKLHTTAESHHRVMVLEVMGRYAGWIALHAGIAGGADVILIPEVPFTYEKIYAKIEDRKKQGKKFSIVVVAEGAAPANGQMVVKKVIEDSGDPIRLGGIGNVVSDNIEKHTGTESRVTVLGHLQRGGSPTAFDRILATRYGNFAVNMIMERKFGYMASLDTPNITAVPLEEATRKLKNVPVDGDLVKTAKQLGISLGD